MVLSMLLSRSYLSLSLWQNLLESAQELTLCDRRYAGTTMSAPRLPMHSSKWRLQREMSLLNKATMVSVLMPGCRTCWTVLKAYFCYLFLTVWCALLAKSHYICQWWVVSGVRVVWGHVVEGHCNICSCILTTFALSIWEWWFPIRPHHRMRNTEFMCTLWTSPHPFIRLMLVKGMKFKKVISKSGQPCTNTLQTLTLFALYPTRVALANRASTHAQHLQHPFVLRSCTFMSPSPTTVRQ